MLRRPSRSSALWRWSCGLSRGLVRAPARLKHRAGPLTRVSERWSEWCRVRSKSSPSLSLGPSPLRSIARGGHHGRRVSHRGGVSRELLESKFVGVGEFEDALALDVVRLAGLGLRVTQFGVGLVESVDPFTFGVQVAEQPPQLDALGSLTLA